jgi:hypothetical protein
MRERSPGGRIIDGEVIQDSTNIDPDRTPLTQ